VNITKLMRLALDPHALKAIFTWPKFSITSYEMIRDLKRVGLEPLTIIDVGANMGQFAVAAAKGYPAAVIHSFEPGPGAADVLRKCVSSLSGVIVYQTALGEKTGSANLIINQNSFSSSILPLGQAHLAAFPSAKEIGSVAVEVSTLDDIFYNKELISPVLLKLDVQGYERQVIQGAARFLKKVDYVLVETSFLPLYVGEATFSEIFRMLSDAGFSFVRPVGWLANPRSGELLQMDALFLRQNGLG